MSIAITGTTGQLGSLVLSQLLEKVQPKDIIALARSPAKLSSYADQGIQIRAFDYTADRVVLEKSLVGVRSLLLISSSEVGQRASQHKAVIDAAKCAGVKSIVYTSLLKATSSRLDLAREHVETEKYLKESGLKCIILRNGWYVENYVPSIASALEHGALLSAAKDGRFSAATRADYAAAAVAVLTSEPAHSTTYELGGDESFTLQQFAAEIALVSGRQIAYVEKTRIELAEILKSVGLPGPLAEILAQSEEAASQGDLYTESHQLSELLGRKTKSWQSVVKASI